MTESSDTFRGVEESGCLADKELSVNVAVISLRKSPSWDSMVVMVSESFLLVDWWTSESLLSTNSNLVSTYT